MRLRFRNLSIRMKVVTAIMGVCTLVFALVIAAVGFYEVRSFRPNALQDLQAQTRILAANLSPPLMFNDPASATATLGGMHLIPAVSAAVIYNAADKHVFASYAKAPTDVPPLLPGADKTHAFTRGSLWVVEPIRFDNELLGYLYVKKRILPVFSRLPQYGIMIVAVISALILAGFLMLFSVDRTISNPIRTLAQLARWVNQQRDYAARSPVTSVDEIGLLAGAFNDMMATIQYEMSAHHDAQQALRESESRLSNFLDGMPVGVWVSDQKHAPLFVNRHARQLIAREPMRGATPQSVASLYGIFIAGTTEPYPWEQLPLIRALKGETCTVSNIEHHTDERIVPLEITATPIYGPDGQVQYAIATLIDITERLRGQQRILYLAQHDAITGLKNRHGFHQRLEHSIDVARRHKNHVGLLFIDLDHFKAINDSLGHQSADELLLQMGERLSHMVREEDTVARLGGDEFAIVVTDVEDDANVMHLAHKIRDSMLQPYTFEGRELYVTASIGVSVFPRDAQDPDGLVRCADTAMYAVKQGGRNDIAEYTAAMAADATGRLNLVNGLRRALKNNEFVLFYQPQVDARSGECIGAEALIRWQHPERGLVGPYEFIGVAEDSGLIVDIGLWTLREACRQLKVWRMQGMDNVTVAINLSPVQFRQPTLVQTILSVLKEQEVDPRHIELEITENVFLGALESVGDVLRSLKNLGFQIAIDDFGTGYSSLSYLKRFPIDKLKIDRSFVSDITDNPSNAVIASAIVALGKELQILVIAEGVETREQAEFLVNRGCDQFQGYLYGRPVPARVFGDTFVKPA